MIFALPMVLMLVLLFAAPMAIVIYMSVHVSKLSGSYYTLEFYRQAITDSLYLSVYWNTVAISVLSVAVGLLLSYPVAYHLSRQTVRMRALLSALVLLPFYTSILVKSYAFTVILGDDGVINQVIGLVFGESTRVSLLFNRTGVIIAIVHFVIPLMVFPILASLVAQPPALRTAAEVMGASNARIFWRITFPLSLPGVATGAIMSLIMSLGIFITPALLGGRRDMMIANLINYYLRETLDWQIAAALSIVLLAIGMIFVVMLMRLRGAQLFTNAS